MNDCPNNTTDSLYAKPEFGIDVSDCFFYHQMDLPGVGKVGAQWDIECDSENYLGKIDFRGKRVLDVGTASGFLTFEMEKRGAEVVSFDMVDASQWDIVPRATIAHRMDEEVEVRRKILRRLRNAYWFAHEKLQSKAQVFLGNVYDMPLELGQFDIVFFGMILGHLQNPFKALHSASRLCKGSIVVANQTVNSRKSTRVPFAHFMPNVSNDAIDCWWSMSDKCIGNMLEVLGFETENQIRSKPKCIVDGRVGIELCTTTVTQRKVGEPEAAVTKAA